MTRRDMKRRNEVLMLFMRKERKQIRKLLEKKILNPVAKKLKNPNEAEDIITQVLLKAKTAGKIKDIRMKNTKEQDTFFSKMYFKEIKRLKNKFKN